MKKEDERDMRVYTIISEDGPISTRDILKHEHIEIKIGNLHKSLVDLRAEGQITGRKYSDGISSSFKWSIINGGDDSLSLLEMRSDQTAH